MHKCSLLSSTMCVLVNSTGSLFRVCGVEVNKPSYVLYCWIFSVKFLHVLELVIHKLYLATLVCISDPCIPNSFVGYIGGM
jgi:hypothetical protein